MYHARKQEIKDLFIEINMKMLEKQKQLKLAAQEDDIDLVTSLLSSKVSPNYNDINDVRPIL